MKIRRLRYADDILLKDETRYISLTLCPNIHKLDMEHSLIKYYEEKYHLVLENTERTIGSSIVCNGEKDNYFQNDDPLSLFVLDGVIICTGNKVVEIERSYYRGDRYKFSISTKPVLISSFRKNH